MVNREETLRSLWTRVALCCFQSFSIFGVKQTSTCRQRGRILQLDKIQTRFAVVVKVNRHRYTSNFNENVGFHVEDSSWFLDIMRKWDCTQTNSAMVPSTRAIHLLASSSGKILSSSPKNIRTMFLSIYGDVCLVTARHTSSAWSPWIVPHHYPVSEALPTRLL